jgi:hypothetical protein
MSRVPREVLDDKWDQLKEQFNSNFAGAMGRSDTEDHVWFEDRWMVASLYDE